MDQTLGVCSLQMDVLNVVWHDLFLCAETAGMLSGDVLNTLTHVVYLSLSLQSIAATISMNLHNGSICSALHLFRNFLCSAVL
jgi:hypothetical protein